MFGLNGDSKAVGSNNNEESKQENNEEMKDENECDIDYNDLDSLFTCPGQP